MLPVFLPDDGVHFPDPNLADADGLVAIGGNLNEDRLLRAYSLGIFPWYSADTPILWWSPDPRCVLFPDELHLSRRLQRLVRSGRFSVTLNTAFSRVINNCAHTPRRGQSGTWLVPEMIEAYIRLFRKGFAYSAEAWLDGELVGGLYGVHLGSVFFGESMFHHVPDASKVAFAALCDWLREHGCTLIDCQQTTRYMLTFGARELPRRDFLRHLAKATLDQALPPRMGGAVLPDDI